MIRFGRVRSAERDLCETEVMAGSTILQQPFVQVALPIIIALMLAAWMRNKRFDDLNLRISELRSDFSQRFDEIIRRLDRIESKLEHHNERITRLEERTSLLR